MSPQSAEAGPVQLSRGEGRARSYVVTHLGGDVAMISALRAMRATGALDGARVIVITTGDEKAVGGPRDLCAAAQRAAILMHRLIENSHHSMIP